MLLAPPTTGHIGRAAVSAIGPIRRPSGIPRRRAPEATGGEVAQPSAPAWLSWFNGFADWRASPTRHQRALSAAMVTSLAAPAFRCEVCGFAS